MFYACFSFSGVMNSSLCFRLGAGTRYYYFMRGISTLMLNVKKNGLTFGWRRMAKMSFLNITRAKTCRMFSVKSLFWKVEKKITFLHQLVLNTRGFYHPLSDASFQTDYCFVEHFKFKFQVLPLKNSRTILPECPCKMRLTRNYH